MYRGQCEVGAELVEGAAAAESMRRLVSGAAAEAGDFAGGISWRLGPGAEGFRAGAGGVERGSKSGSGAVRTSHPKSLRVLAVLARLHEGPQNVVHKSLVTLTPRLEPL